MLFKCKTERLQTRERERGREREREKGDGEERQRERRVQTHRERDREKQIYEKARGTQKRHSTSLSFFSHRHPTDNIDTLLPCL